MYLDSVQALMGMPGLLCYRPPGTAQVSQRGPCEGSDVTRAGGGGGRGGGGWGVGYATVAVKDLHAHEHT